MAADAASAAAAASPTTSGTREDAIRGVLLEVAPRLSRCALADRPGSLLRFLTDEVVSILPSSYGAGDAADLDRAIELEAVASGFFKALLHAPLHCDAEREWRPLRLLAQDLRPDLADSMFPLFANAVEVPEEDATAAAAAASGRGRGSRAEMTPQWTAAVHKLAASLELRVEALGQPPAVVVPPGSIPELPSTKGNNPFKRGLPSAFGLDRVAFSAAAAPAAAYPPAGLPGRTGVGNPFGAPAFRPGGSRLSPRGSRPSGGPLGPGGLAYRREGPSPGGNPFGAADASPGGNPFGGHPVAAAHARPGGDPFGAADARPGGDPLGAADTSPGGDPLGGHPSSPEGFLDRGGSFASWPPIPASPLPVQSMDEF